MAYYTDEDRKRAAYVRNRNRVIKRLSESPEDSFDILGVKVPRVTKKPEYSDFGINEHTEADLAGQDAEYIRRSQFPRKIIYWIFVVTALVISLGTLGLGLTFGLGVFLVFVLIGVYELLMEVKPRRTQKHIQLEKYKNQKKYYEYWKRKKDKDYWNQLTGAQFEQAVANLLRQVGFGAEVSRQGGDGGIDIVLSKGSRRIAVQCKRYSKAVGPHVIRDLWGTMNHRGFNEGCIVTTTGFTKGVKDFALGRKIYLIDLNDILRATNSDSLNYLESKMK